jgi:hypothetical protein
MDKVKVTKEVAEAIETLRTQGCSSCAILLKAEGALTSEPDLTLNKWAFGFEGGTPDFLMTALVNGYEVEKTPEDEVREYYDGLNFDPLACEICPKERRVRIEKRLSIRLTLNKLGITIEGVND